jgi:hypothetical protein
MNVVNPYPLHRLQQQADRIGRLAHELVTATPRQAEGCDTTGRVVVVLDHDGVPERIRVIDGWQERLDSHRLGAAAVEAFGDAVQQAMRTWTRRLDDTRWWSRQREPDEAPDAAPRAGASPPVSGRVQHDLEYSEPILRALHSSRRPGNEQPPAAEGADEAGYVTVRLGAGGLVGCEIEPRWARDRAGTTITAALDRALSRARTALATPSRIEASAAVDTALADALATLEALTDQTPGRGDRR